MRISRWIQPAATALTIILSSFSFLGISTIAAGEEVIEPSKVSGGEVIELTDDTFEHLTQASTGQTTGKWFVKFYAPWCGHCKSLAPVWDKLADVVAAEHADTGIIIAKIDNTKHTEIRARFGITGFPTLKYFADRKMYTYKGKRDLESLTEFVTSGYTDAEPEEIPAPPAWFETKVKDVRKAVESYPVLVNLIRDFEHIIMMRKNAAIILCVLGAIFALLLVYCIHLLRVLRKIEKKQADTKNDEKKKK
eukprot:CAMPEP_0195522428 /NCGR_PEP_ID=MMETSP0794_2-20130614/20598_1 /TAXON_ID=515487 /ORGANISM="Stephanopyxis turris, Strain CCMP 815" /LENGTH=249 /DNA_ID=CAMNT_0040652185 /DNA_START=104 /DNA_END=853 /DNA_ORIENTATION=-